MLKSFWLLLSGISLVSLASRVDAQTREPQDGVAEPGVIVVTALSDRQKLTDAPASITAFDQKTLQTTGVTRAEQFIQLTPGVTIVTSTTEAADTQINIRGINGARDAESSVALVVDGILKTNVGALNQDQSTLTQVEVLKGPQGAIYGRNASAGAIVIQTLKPTDVLHGGGKASYANENTFSGNAYISGPITKDVGFVLSGDYRTTNGYFRNSYLANRKVVDYQSSWNINARVLADLSDTTIDAKVHYGKLSGGSINYNAVFSLPAFAAQNPDFYADVNGHQFRYYDNIVPTNNQKTTEGSIKIDHDFDAVTLSTWVAYSDIDSSLGAGATSADFQRFTSAVNPAVQPAVNSCFATTASLTGFPVNSPAFIGTTPFASMFGPWSPTTCDGSQYQRRRQRDFSAEIRLRSHGSGALEWQIGGYYLYVNRTVLINLMADTGFGLLETDYAPPGSLSPTTQLYHDKLTTNDYALFGSARYSVTNALKIGAALRYDVEDRRVDNRVPFVNDPFTGAPINLGQTTGTIPTKRATFSQLQPRIEISYKVSRAATVYTNWGVGFKSGGFNNQGTAAVVASAFNAGLGSAVRIDDNYRKERSSAFEAGLKGQVGPFSYSAAGYYTRVRDMQFFEFLIGSFGLLRAVSNIDRVDLKGIEASGSLKLVKGWSLFASGNYTDSEIKKNSSRPSTVGNKSPYTAEYTINLGSQMEAPISRNFDLILRADYRITGPTWFHTIQNQEVPSVFGAPGRFDLTRREAFGVLDLRFGLQAKQWSASLFARNALDRKYVSEVSPAIEFGGAFVAPGARALYGAELGLRF